MKFIEGTPEELRRFFNLDTEQEHDGCEGCVFMSCKDNEYPCSSCKQNYMDLWVKETE